MNPTEHAVISALANASHSHTPAAVWNDDLPHVPSVNENINAAIRSCVLEVKSGSSENPVGLPIIGSKGSGKTHELAYARREIQEAGGIFIHVDAVSSTDFWSTVRSRLLDALDRPHAQGGTQSKFLIERLIAESGVGDPYAERLRSGKRIVGGDIHQFTTALAKKGHRSTMVRRMAAALAVMQADTPDTHDIGFDLLAGNPENKEGDREDLQLSKASMTAKETVRYFSQLAGIVAPIVIGVDQLDIEMVESDGGTQGPDPSQASGRSLLGAHLTDLRDAMSRTVTIVACQPWIWRQMTHGEANRSVKDRFRPQETFTELASAEAASELVAAHFKAQFDQLGFNPEYSTWPVKPACFNEAWQYRPRDLLGAISEQLRTRLQSGSMTEIDSLSESSTVAVVPHPRIAPEELQRIDELFAAYREEADVDAAFKPSTEDKSVPGLLRVGFDFAIREQGSHASDWQVVTSRKAGSGWHAQVVKDLGNGIEDPAIWTIGFLSHTHWKAMRSRTKKLLLHSQVGPRASRRNAILVRPNRWRSTETAKATENEFTNAGGQIITEELHADLKAFRALERLEAEAHREFERWLGLRRPAGSTRIAREVFGDPPEISESGLPADPDSTRSTTPSSSNDGPAPSPPADPQAAATQDPLRLGLGVSESQGASVAVDLEALRKHVAIFAGSGSGKTVLIRRLVEECALRGVSTIILDPNNDLARLGEAWPEAPSTWLPGDEDLAERYLKDTEVIIWTPRREAGRPLTFQPLPDFDSVIDDPDEYNQALDTAVSALAPRARVDRGTAKADQGRAVLREALRHFSKRSPTAGLSAFIDLLADLPEDITSIDKASSMAHDMAQTLAAAAINDPLFGGGGTPLDPGVLLTPSADKRARISVISFIGLADSTQRQSFVNQLQMALFAWIKRNPCTDKPLGGLMVMDEAQTFAPSGSMTTCTESTLALASQARKYGLGLVFATQAPRGIHNRIVGNASTQFFGFLNSPPQIDAAKEMARSKSSSVPDISRLSAGEFYAVSEGLRFQKISVPMCLSHHPRSALTSEEVLALAQV